ncbi:MAG: ABC transporter permease subunit [Desulfurococcaceae archaeon]|uniref:ABC transporter permease subunit n=2 Tax=Staphylothermus marinus TaxID=2280 RepID=A0A7C4D821_STAMA
MAFTLTRVILRIFLTTIGLLILFIMLYPIIFIILQSMYSKASLLIDLNDVFANLTFENYFRSITSPGFLEAVYTSLIVTISTIIVSLVVITPAAYSFSRFYFKGRDTLLYIYLILSQAGGGFGIIAIIALLMFLLIMSGYGIPLFGTHILPFIYTAGLVPFQTWLLKSYFDNLPKELDEAAFIDGANWFTIIFKVILPSSKPAMIIITLFAFMSAWSEFFIANLLRITTVGAYIFRTAFGARGLQDPSLYAALSIIYAIPIIIIYIVAQKYIGEAYRMGIVKG